jgi:AbrB family looped-hinge helix DNA binding protein
MRVKMRKEGRLVIPKSIREKYELEDGTEFEVRASKAGLILTPFRRYRYPTEALYGSIKAEPIDEPKEFARRFIRRKLVEEPD